MAGSPCGCLTEETQVLTEDGLKAIAELKDGDIVLSYNGTLGIYELKPIYKAYNPVSDTLFYIQLSNEIIRSTKDHPFLTKRGWIEATRLIAGDSLQTQSGKYIAVISIAKKLEYENVFNFEVKDYHTYFIGKNRVVVNNALGGPCNMPSSQKASGFYRVTEKRVSIILVKEISSDLKHH